jgi:hypothetical protein
MNLLDSPALYGHTIFCDDIRDEVGGKSSFIGVYRNNMFVNSGFPLVLPKMGFAIFYAQHRDKLVIDTMIRIYLPGDAEENASIQLQIPEEAWRQGMAQANVASPLADHERTYVALGLNFVFSPLKIDRPGTIKVRATHGDELVRLGTLRVVDAPQQSTTPPAA